MLKEFLGRIEDVNERKRHGSGTMQGGSGPSKLEEWLQYWILVDGEIDTLRRKRPMQCK